MVVSTFKKCAEKNFTKNLTENTNNFLKGANFQISVVILPAILKSCLKNELYFEHNKMPKCVDL